MKTIRLHAKELKNHCDGHDVTSLAIWKDCDFDSLVLYLIKSKSKNVTRDVQKLARFFLDNPHVKYPGMNNLIAFSELRSGINGVAWVNTESDENCLRYGSYDSLNVKGASLKEINIFDQSDASINIHEAFYE